MKIRVRVSKAPKDGFIGLRVESPLKEFFSTAAVLLDRPEADLERHALRDARRTLLRREPRLRRELKRLHPTLLNGL